MPFRTQNFRCAEHGVFEDIVSVPPGFDGGYKNIAPQVCSKCGNPSPAVMSAPAMVNPKFVQFKDDTKNRARKLV